MHRRCFWSTPFPRAAACWAALRRLPSCDEACSGRAERRGIAWLLDACCGQPTWCAALSGWRDIVDSFVLQMVVKVAPTKCPLVHVGNTPGSSITASHVMHTYAALALHCKRHVSSKTPFSLSQHHKRAMRQRNKTGTHSVHAYVFVSSQTLWCATTAHIRCAPTYGICNWRSLHEPQKAYEPKKRMKMIVVPGYW